MLKSLYSGISGMKVNQTKLDVIGNNIANVGTTAFKSSTTRFSDMLSQSIADPMAASDKQGGTNAKQVGLGVQLASIATVMTQGTMQPTNRALDIAVDGTGYFIVSKGPAVFDESISVDHTPGNHNITEQSGNSISYTRDGAFTLDEEGNLLTADGLRILGYSLSDGGVTESIAADGSINFVDSTKDLEATDGELKTLRIPEKVKLADGTELRIKNYSIDKNGIINGVLEDGRVTALGQIAMASFKNEEGLTKQGGNTYGSSVNSGEAVIKSGVGAIAANDNSKGYGDNIQGMLEMSNVDLSEQFTEMIVATRAFQASGKMITTGDEILQDIINLKR